MAKAPVIHRSKLFSGKQTANEVHREHAWAGGRCCVCNTGDIVVQLSYFQSPLDLALHEPRIAAMLLATSENGQMPIWQSKYGPMTPYWTEHACSSCQGQVERAAAHLPSYVFVQIDRGVGADKAIVAVPRSYRPKARRVAA